MDLADRGRGERTLVELREHARQRRAELRAQQLLEPRERHRRDAVAQRRKLALQLVLLVLGEAVELDHREHLPDLHRRAAHPPELLDELADERRGPFVLGGGGALGRPHPVGRPHPRPPHALPGHQPANPRRPRDPPRRELLRLARGIVVR